MVLPPLSRSRAGRMKDITPLRRRRSNRKPILPDLNNWLPLQTEWVENAGAAEIVSFKLNFFIK